MSFNGIIEEVQKLSLHEKIELESLIQKYIIEEKRKEIQRNYELAKLEEAEGKLKKYQDVKSFLKGINEE
ncbi:MAG: hypothetical protein SFU91_11595 [Chloroherpetonaceae bacterium]|nr:hypothetical protein [Chloroherpetonaceae bacterium]